MTKWTCIKRYNVLTDKTRFYEIGQNATIVEYNNGNIFIGPYSDNDNACIPMWVVDKKVYEHFITLSEWRERQINSILNEDSDNNK